MKYRTHKRRSGYPDHGVGGPNTIITPARHRILSLALALSLALGMTLYLPGPVTVRAELPPYGNDAEGKPWDGINFEALEGSGLYYGTYDHAVSFNAGISGAATKWDEERPVLWRVMGEEQDSDNLTLLSEYVLDSAVFNQNTGDGNVYDTSAIKNTLAAMSDDIFQGTESAYVEPVTVKTRMHNTNTGVEVNDPVDSFTQTLYLPWGKFNEYMLYWDAGSDDTNYAYNLSTPSARLRGGSTAVFYWLRSPYAAGLPRQALAVDGGGLVFSDFVDRLLGIRPAFQFNPSSVIFTSVVSDSADPTKGETPSDSDYSHDAVVGGGANNYKLTIASPDVELNGLSVTDGRLGGNGTSLTIAPGGTLSMTGDFSGGENLVYKIVDRGSNTIVGYGSGTGDSLDVRATANVTGAGGLSPTGNYTLYVWAQKDGGIRSHEGSWPMWYKLNVGSADSNADLATVAGEPITLSANAGNMGDPYIDSIDLDYSKDKIAVSDIVPTDLNATVKLYTDAGFSANEDSDILLDHGIPTDLYIKVTAEDGTTMRYYKITATRDNATPDPGQTIDPSVIIDNSDLKVGDTTTLHISLGQSGGVPLAAQADINSDRLDIASVDPDNLTADGDVEVTGESEGTATITVTFSGGDLTGTVVKTVAVTVSVSDGNGGGSSSSGSRSSSSDGGSSTPDSQVFAKAILPASAFSWDGERTLTINHGSLTPQDLRSVQWNGKTLVLGRDYSVSAGSVILRFSEDLMAAQAPGNHTVRVEFLNHYGETTVATGEAEPTASNAGDDNNHNPETGGYPGGSFPGTGNPNTGDGRGIWPALLLGGLGAAALEMALQKDEGDRQM